MHITDFEYNGKTLSSIGYVVCGISTEYNSDTTIGSALTLNTIKNMTSSRNHLITQSYDDAITFTCDIMKNPCSDDDHISDYDLRELSQWLQRREYKKFVPGYDDGSFANTYLMGSFTTISAITDAIGIAGLTLSFTADSPFAYGEPITVSGTSPLTVLNENDEYGCFYPTKFIITCNATGNIYLKNSADNKNRFTEIKNCQSGEVITLDCENKIITTSRSGHAKLYNDFNYNFPRLVKTDNPTTETNQFTNEIASNLSITYAPIRKVGVLV